MTIETSAAPSDRFANVLVLVGDAQRARVVRPSPGTALEVLWEGYPATPNVRSLDQAPDITRNSSDATSRVPAESSAEFARDVAARVLGLTASTPGVRLIVIAPSSFVLPLRAELGAAWPSRHGDVIERDETRLDDTALRTVIETTLKARN